MGVPEMDVQEPVVGPTAAFQPIEGAGQDLVGALGHPAAHEVHGLHEAVVPPGGRMAEGKARQRRGVPAVPIEQAGTEQGIAAHETAPGPLVAELRGAAAVIDDAVADAEGASEESGPTGKTGDIGGVGMGEAQAVGGQGVDVRSGGSGGSRSIPGGRPAECRCPGTESACHRIFSQRHAPPSGR